LILALTEQKPYNAPMDDVQRAIAAAWRNVRRQLLNHPNELHQRIARRHAGLVTRPPRAWCLAVRASDTRLGPLCTARPDPSTAHRVILDSPSLRRLCAPVYIERPGLPVQALASRLGVRPQGLLDARLTGRFQTRHVHGLGGHWGRPTPLLYTPGPLDPSARGFASTDPVWSATARHLPGRIPGSIRQTLTRVPVYQPVGTPDADPDQLHPEHPHLDPEPHSGERRSLPTPTPDPAWYKWRDGQYLGYDWRNPASAASHRQRTRKLESAREVARLKRLHHPPPSRAAGSLQFRGWRWLCPRCRRRVNLLFYPLPRLHLLNINLHTLATPASSAPNPRGRHELHGLHDPRRQGSTGGHKAPPPRPGIPPAGGGSKARPSFACEKCHRIKRLSRCDKNAWNELVTYLSAGLLYGREVRRPDWFTPTRKIPFTPRPQRAPSRRRLQIEQRLLGGESFRHIAGELSLAYGTVLWYAQQVYKQHGVNSLPGLLRKHGQSPTPPKRHQVHQRLAAGQPIPQIAQEIGISKMAVYNHVYMLRREGKLPRRRGARTGTSGTP
jgi:hypothetical protein